MESVIDKTMDPANAALSVGDILFGLYCDLTPRYYKVIKITTKRVVVRRLRSTKLGGPSTTTDTRSPNKIERMTLCSDEPSAFIHHGSKFYRFVNIQQVKNMGGTVQLPV